LSLKRGNEGIKIAVIAIIAKTTKGIICLVVVLLIVNKI